MDGATEIQKRDLIEALRKLGENQSEAARLLGASRVTVWSRIKKRKIDLRRAIPWEAPSEACPRG
jgi:two-component system response regulator HydG